MKHYIKPTIELMEVDNTMPLASSPTISERPAPDGAEACSLDEGNAAIVFDANDTEGN